MRSVFDYVGNLDTLLAVCVGAVLATLGALFAELIQERLGRRRRERDAARFFGEILASIDALVDRAVASQQIGDPWGPVSTRLYKTALREAEVYDRNRERLFDIRDASLRARIHGHVVSETFPLESIVDNCEDFLRLAEDVAEGRPNTETLSARMKDLADGREGARDFLLHERAKTGEILLALERIGKASFNLAPP